MDVTGQYVYFLSHGLDILFPKDDKYLSSNCPSSIIQWLEEHCKISKSDMRMMENFINGLEEEPKKMCKDLELSFDENKDRDFQRIYLGNKKSLIEESTRTSADKILKIWIEDYEIPFNFITNLNKDISDVSDNLIRWHFFDAMDCIEKWCATQVFLEEEMQSFNNATGFHKLAIYKRLTESGVYYLYHILHPEEWMNKRTKFIKLLRVLKGQFLSVYGDTLKRLYPDESETEKREPEILKNPDVKRMMGYLIKDGLLGENYEWQGKGRIGSKRKLAYLCYRLSDQFGLGKNVRIKDDKETIDISWQPFEELFQVKGLRFDFNGLKNGSGLKSYPEIDKYFD